METLQRTANRGSISTGGYEIDNSLKLEIDNNEWIYRSSPTAGNRRTFTISLWLKRACLGHIPAGGDEYLAGQGSNARYHFAGNTVRFMFESGSTELESSRVLRDPAAFYHIVLAVDTTQGTAADRVKLYINGVQEAWNNTKFPNQNQESDWMNTQNLYIGTRYAGDGDNDLAGYISEVVVLDGTAASPTDLGEYDDDSGIWKPIDVSDLTFGSEGFYYKFDNASSLGEDSSGNGNDATLNNISSADQATDTPTNNFCTLNPLFTGFNSSVQLPINGATQYGLSGGNQDLSYAGTMGVTKGKWYFENYINEVNGTYGARIYVGFHTFQQDYDGVQVGGSTQGDALAVWQMNDGNYVAWNGGSRSITSGLGTVSSSGAGKFVGIALNLDDNQISFYYDGSAVTNGTNLPLYNMGTQTDDGIFAIPVVQTKGSIQTVNFGGYTGATISSGNSDESGYGNFEHSVPTGYYALCSRNLSELG